MNKELIKSVIGYFIVTMALAYPWHMLLFHDKYIAMGAFTRGKPIMPFGMLAVLIQAIVFAYFYPMYLQYKKTDSSVKSGVKYSLLMGLNVYTVMVFATAAKFKIEPVMDFVLYGTGFQFLQFFFVGMMLGLVHRK